MPMHTGSISYVSDHVRKMSFLEKVFLFPFWKRGGVRVRRATYPFLDSFPFWFVVQTSGSPCTISLGLIVLPCIYYAETRPVRCVRLCTLYGFSTYSRRNIDNMLYDIKRSIMRPNNQTLSKRHRKNLDYAETLQHWQCESTFLSNSPGKSKDLLWSSPGFVRFLSDNSIIRWRWVWSSGGVLLTRENRSTRKITTLGTTLSTTNPTRNK